MATGALQIAGARRPGWRKALDGVPLHVFFIVAGVLWALPAIGLLLTSLRPVDLFTVSGWWTAISHPQQLSITNYLHLFDSSLIDDILEVDFRLAYTRALELCQNEGLLAGPSSGLILEGAQEMILRDKVGFGVMIFPDGIFKYTSNMMKHIPGLGAGTSA